MIRRMWAWLAERRRRRALAKARKADARSSARGSRMLEEMARLEADYAESLPHGPQRVAALMQRYIYEAQAAAWRAREGGDVQGWQLHRDEANDWRRRLDQHLGAQAMQQAGNVVRLDTRRVQMIREAGL